MSADPWLTHFGDQLDARRQEVAAAAGRIHARLAAIAAEGAAGGHDEETILTTLTVAMELSPADRATAARALALYALRAHQGTGRGPGPAGRLPAAAACVRSAFRRLR